MGRAEIARASSLSVQTVSNIISSLQAEGLLVEDGQSTRGRGLPAPLYRINARGAYALGFEVRPQSVTAALLDISGQTILSAREPLPDICSDKVGLQLKSLMGNLLSRAKLKASSLLGAGVVMPGPFIETGLANTSSVLPGWEGIDAVQLFSDCLQVPVLIENDANAAAVAERVSGCAGALNNFAFIYFGTGLGLGVVHEGQLYRGARGNAGEIGHILVPDSRSASNHSPKKTSMVPLENITSRLALQNQLAQQGLKADTVDDIAQLGLDENPHLERWLNDAAPALSHAIHIVENLFDPETVVLGGALPDSVLRGLIDRLCLADLSIAARENRLIPRVIAGKSGPLSAAQGGAALVINKLFTPQLALAS